MDSSSKITSSKGTYRWYLSKEIDPYDNEIVYSYSKEDNYPYLSKIEYALKNSVAHFYIEFFYENRADVIDDLKSGVKFSLKKRCSDVYVKSYENHIIRHYELIYENLLQSSLSRIKNICQHGENDQDTDPAFPCMSFKYSDLTLTVPTTSKMDFADGFYFPPSLNKKRASIVDMNRDSIADIIETSSYGARVWINKGDNTFLESYAMPEIVSVLGTANTKLIDVDGDRVVDLVATGLYPKYFKGGLMDGNGNFLFSPDAQNITAIPRYSIGGREIRTFDANNDGRLDIIAREVDHIKTFISDEKGSWDRAQDFVINTDFIDFKSRFTFMSDMNSDGLTDIALLREKTFLFLGNKGDGTFEMPIRLTFQEADPLILKLARLHKATFVEDFNGDGLKDIIVAWSNGLAVSFNKGNQSFGNTYQFNNVHEFNFDLKGMSIVMGDMNGNGTQDILWSNDFHDYRYLDLVDIKSNLIVEVKNGLGLKTVIDYKASTEFSHDDEALESSLPFSKMVVSKIHEYIWSNASPQKIDEYSYHGGYYDEYENQFAGFNLVKTIQYGDASIDSLLTKNFYEQGRTAEDRYLRSVPSKQIIQDITLPSYSEGEILQEVEYVNSAVLTFPSDEQRVPMRPYVSEAIYKEGDSDPLTPSRSRKDTMDLTINNDGILESRVVTTYSDLVTVEKSTETTYAINNNLNLNIINRPCQIDIKDSSSNLISSKRIYYDDNTNLCEVDEGSVSKIMAWNGSDYEIKSSYEYTGFGAINSIKDSFDHATNVTYDNYYLYPIEVTNSASHTKTATYDYASGKINSLTDENNRTTVFDYDIYLRLSKIVGPADSSTYPTIEALMTFGNEVGTPSSILVKKRKKSGSAATLDIKEYFDPKGRSLGNVKVGESNKYIYSGGTEYNLRDQKYKEYLPKFVSSLDFPGMDTSSPFRMFEYDAIKRPLKEYNPEHTATVPSYKSYIYKVGKKYAHDELNKVTLTELNSLGLTTSVTDHNDQSVTYEWNELKKIIKIIDPQDSETLFDYDSEGRRTCKLDPNLGLTKYFYNSEDLVTRKDIYGYISGQTDCSTPSATPRTIQLEYNDNLNRQTKIDYPASASLNADILFTYDETSRDYGIGKLTTVNFGSGSKTFDYDVYGNKSKNTLNINSNNYVTEIKFDALQRIEEVVYPSISGATDLEIKYSYNQSGQLSEIKNDLTNAIYANNLSYNSLEKLTDINFGNGVQTSFTYDITNKSYRLINILTSSSKSIRDMITSPLKTLKEGMKTTYQNIDYTYDKVSNITEREDILNNFTENYSYDNLHRLTEAVLDSARTENFSYDEIGNITEKTIDDGNIQTLDYSYSSTRKQILTNVASASLTFDDFGNITNDSTRSYVFDWNNQPYSITNTSTSYFKYDAEGMRVEKITNTATTYYIDQYTEIRNGDVIRHIYMNDDLIASIDQDDNVVYTHKDHLGSGNVRTNSSGAQVNRLEYFPFGEKRINTGSSNFIKQRFTGQIDDEESEIYYYKHRYYNPNLGRFISADQLYAEEMDKRGINSQEMNLYAYVRNNPLIYVDPDGYLTERDYFLLSFLKPDMNKTMTKVLTNLEEKGFQPKVVETYRTEAQQKAKVEDGYSQTMNSAHRNFLGIDVIDKRYGYNDISDGKPGPANEFFKEYGKEVNSAGLTWGGDFDDSANSKITGYGWDPAHAESSVSNFGYVDDKGNTYHKNPENSSSQVSDKYVY